MKVFSIVAIAMSLAFTGCVTDGRVSEVREKGYEPGIAEREGLALARIVTAEYSIVGFTYADCKEAGGWAPIALPFILLKTVPAGYLAACADVLTGTAELLTFHQFKDVSYSWESFDKAKSSKWGEPVLIFYAAALAGAAEGLANSSGGGSSTTTVVQNGGDDTVPASRPQSRPRPRVRHLSCNGTGQCPICRGRGSVGAGMRCSGCGGSRRCRACRGTGYAD